MQFAEIRELPEHYIDVYYEDLRNAKSYRRWLNGEVRLLYCHGGPRSGKTSFARALARQLRKDGMLVESIYLARGSSQTDYIDYIKQVVHPAILIIDGLDCQDDCGLVEKLLTSIPVQTILVQSRIHVEKRSRCPRCNGAEDMLSYRDYEQCKSQHCRLCEKCGHNVQLKVAHVNLVADLSSYVDMRVSDTDVREEVVFRAHTSFVEARLLVKAWLRHRDRAMFDTKDHILECQIEFYDSLLHHVSYVGSVILALVAAEVPFRFDELVDVVHILTGEWITMSSLLRETCHLVDIEWREVPIVEVCHSDIMAFIREEAELPEIDMVELCRQGIDHFGPFSNYALRNWSKFCPLEDRQGKFDFYFRDFDHYRKRTFRALNDDNYVKFYGTHVDHLRAWHGLPVSSEIPDQRGSIPIHIAASCGHEHLMEELAQSQHQRDGRGRTAFEIALEHHKENVCKKLSINWSIANEHSPCYAISRIASKTKEPGANGRTPLWDAIDLGDKDLISLLLAQLDIDKINRIDSTLVEYAWGRNNDIALRLIDNARNLKSRCLADMLKYSIEKNRQDSVKTLVSKGADLWGYAHLGLLPSETAQSCGANNDTIKLVRQIEEIFINGEDLKNINHIEVCENKQGTGDGKGRGY